MSDITRVVRSPAHTSFISFTDRVNELAGHDVSDAFNVKVANVFWKHQGINTLFDPEKLAVQVASAPKETYMPTVVGIYELIHKRLDFAFSGILTPETRVKFRDFAPGVSSHEDELALLNDVKDQVNAVFADQVKQWQDQVKVITKLGVRPVNKEKAQEWDVHKEIADAKFYRIQQVMVAVREREVLARILPVFAVKPSEEDAGVIARLESDSWSEAVLEAFSHMLRYDRAFYRQTWEELHVTL